MRLFREHWHQIVIGLILLAVPSFITWVLPGGWGTIGSWFGSFFGWLGSDVTIARWSFLLFWLCVILLATIILLIGRNYLVAKRNAAQYVSDIVFDVKWRWRWTPNGIQDLVPFCPHCDFQIQPVGGGSYIMRGTTYECDNPECGNFNKDFEEDYDDVRDLVIRKIQQDLRAHFAKP